MNILILLSNTKGSSIGCRGFSIFVRSACIASLSNLLQRHRTIHGQGEDEEESSSVIEISFLLTITRNETTNCFPAFQYAYAIVI